MEAENKCLKRKLVHQAELEFDFFARIEEMKSLRKFLANEIKTKKMALSELDDVKAKFDASKKALEVSLCKINDLESYRVDTSFYENNESIKSLNFKVNVLQGKLDQTNCKIGDLRIDKQRLRNHVKN